MAGFQFQKLQTSIEYALYVYFAFSDIIFLFLYFVMKSGCFCMGSFAAEENYNGCPSDSRCIGKLKSSRSSGSHVCLNCYCLYPLLSLEFGLSDATFLLPG